jgi:hypothetical protein
MAASEPPKKNSKLHMFVASLVIIVFVFLVAFMTLLAADVFTIPYLTPFAHFIAIILAPFAPLVAPLMLGEFLKVCQHEAFPGKKTWIFVTACWCFNQVQRVCQDVGRLWSWTGEDDALEICGMSECKGSWVEVGLLVIVVLGQWRGWRWDMGLADKWVEGIVAQGRKTEEAKRLKAMGGDVEKGVVVDEKKEVVVEDEVVGADIEKTTLLVEVEDVEKA